jgi:hypothetical protein
MVEPSSKRAKPETQEYKDVASCIAIFEEAGYFTNENGGYERAIFNLIIRYLFPVRPKLGQRPLLLEDKEHELLKQELGVSYCLPGVYEKDVPHLCFAQTSGDYKPDHPKFAIDLHGNFYRASEGDAVQHSGYIDTKIAKDICDGPSGSWCLNPETYSSNSGFLAVSGSRRIDAIPYSQPTFIFDLYQLLDCKLGTHITPVAISVAFFLHFESRLSCSSLQIYRIAQGMVRIFGGYAYHSYYPMDGIIRIYDIRTHEPAGEFRIPPPRIEHEDWSDYGRLELRDFIVYEDSIVIRVACLGIDEPDRLYTLAC